jgi:hypothetical protein
MSLRRFTPQYSQDARAFISIGGAGVAITKYQPVWQSFVGHLFVLDLTRRLSAERFGFWNRENSFLSL